MPMVSSDFARALEPNILSWIHDGVNEHPDITSEVFNILDKSTGVIRLHDSFGPNNIPVSSEGAATSELSQQRGYLTTSAPKIYKGKISVTAEMKRWGMYDELKSYSQDLGKAAIQSINRIGAGVFIGGFNTAKTFYGDAKPIFSTVHPRPDGGTAQSNASSTGITLTEANLETAMVALKQQKSGTGRKLAIGNGNIVLMVPEQLDKEAIIITGSQKRSGTGNNDLNWYLGKIAVFVNPFIGADVNDLDGTAGSDTAWFLFAKGQHKLTFIWDQRPIYRSWENEDTDALYTKIYFSCKAGWNGYYGTWGSKGDGAAYSS